MSERQQNWYTRFVKWFGPSLFLETGNPRMDAGGGSAFALFGSTKKGRKFSLGMKESGVVQLNADSTLEIIAGEDNNVSRVPLSFSPAPKSRAGYKAPIKPSKIKK